MSAMGSKMLVLSLTLLILASGFSSAQAVPPAKIVSGLLSNALSVIMKWVWSLTASTKTAIKGRPMMKFESGYNVETVFDGSKLGIEPYAVEVLPSGELLVLDSANNDLYKISSPLSQYSRPRLVAGSAEGYAGHVDGKHREARMNHPKGLTVDDRGNIYIADTTNMAIRKISDAGVTTIAGGKWSRGGGHVDGPSEDAKFSNDFDVVYIGSSCSLLVIDRGNQAIREIQLHFEDCAYQYGSGFPLGIIVLVAAGFFGYMLALLQRRVGTIVSPQNDEKAEKLIPMSPYQKPMNTNLLVRPPLIPSEGDPEKQEETFFGSLSGLISTTGASFSEIFGGIFPWFKKKPLVNQYQNQQPNNKYLNSWSVQESFVIPDGDEPPPIDPRTPTPRKTYAFMTKDVEKMQQLRQSRAFYSGWDGEQSPHKGQYQNQHSSSVPQTYFEQNFEKTNEVVFGAVQEQDGKSNNMVIKPLDHANPVYGYHNVRSRGSYLGYNNGY